MENLDYKWQELVVLDPPVLPIILLDTTSFVMIVDVKIVDDSKFDLHNFSGGRLDRQFSVFNVVSLRLTQFSTIAEIQQLPKVNKYVLL